MWLMRVSFKHDTISVYKGLIAELTEPSDEASQYAGYLLPNKLENLSVQLSTILTKWRQ